MELASDRIMLVASPCAVWDLVLGDIVLDISVQQYHQWPAFALFKEYRGNTCRHAGPEILIIAIAALPGAVESAYIVDSAPKETESDAVDNSSITEEALRIPS
jgi:hypothetical protein